MPITTQVQPMLTVSDIKQYMYCPRIPYFHYVLPVPFTTTEKMKQGARGHENFTRKDKRRTTNKYKLKTGRKTFNKRFVSLRLGLSGVLDLLIEAHGQYFPVEYKWSYGEPQIHHRYQLAAYALLVEDATNTVIRDGYIYMTRSNQVFPIELNESRKRQVKTVIKKIIQAINTQTMPAATPSRGKCTNCEYRLYCNDVR